MEHVLQRIPVELRWQVLVPLLLVVAVIGWGFGLGKLPLGPPGLVGLEIARTPARARAIVEGWRQENRTRSVLIGTGIDFLFLFAYSNVLACCCAWYAERFSGGFAAAGVVLALLQWGAALCDMAENFYLFQMVLNSDGAGAQACTGVSLCKWLLIFAGLAYVVVAMVRRCFALMPEHSPWGISTAIGALAVAAMTLRLAQQVWTAWQGGGP